MYNNTQRVHEVYPVNEAVSRIIELYPKASELPPEKILALAQYVGHRHGVPCNPDFSRGKSLLDEWYRQCLITSPFDYPQASLLMRYMKRTFDKYSYFYSWLDSNVKRDGTLEEGARDYHRYVAAMEGSALRARFAGLSEELDMLKREFARPWSHAVSNPPKHVRNPNNELKK